MDSLEVTAVPAFADNYLWLIHGRTNPRQVIAVDPGDATAIQDELARSGLTLAGILITHRHADHVGGVAELQSKFKVPVYGPIHEPVPGEIVAVGDGAHVRFDALDLSFRVLEVPGHTKGHIAFVGHGALFCGDTLFSAGCGRLFEGTPEQMHASLSRLAALPPGTQVYCAHEYTVSNLLFAAAVEPDNSAVTQHLRHCQQQRAQGQMTLPTTLELELRINPFLRVTAQTVKRSASQRAGHALNSDTDTFAVLRAWKNEFRA